MKIEEMPRPGAVSLYVKEPEEDHHFPFACVLHFMNKDHAHQWFLEVNYPEVTP